jgi:hypothetical protein
MGSSTPRGKLLNLVGGLLDRLALEKEEEEVVVGGTIREHSVQIHRRFSAHSGEIQGTISERSDAEAEVARVVGRAES